MTTRHVNKTAADQYLLIRSTSIRYIAYDGAAIIMTHLQLLQRWGQTSRVQSYSRCMYSCARGQHLRVCVCVDAEESVWRSMQAAVLSALQTRLCCWRINAPTGPRARGSKANETAIAQTHPADPWILIRLRREMEAGCLRSRNSSPDKLKRGVGVQLDAGKTSGFSKIWMCGQVLTSRWQIVIFLKVFLNWPLSHIFHILRRCRHTRSDLHNSECNTVSKPLQQPPH